MAISCIVLPMGSSLKRLQTKFHRRSTIEEIPEGRRPSFDQFLDNHFAAARQTHDSPLEEDSANYMEASIASSPDHRTLYRYSSTETVSVINTNSDPRSPVPNQHYAYIPAMPDFSAVASEETITILFTTTNNRDSKDTATLPPAPPQHALKTYIHSHPAIVDNPPPFARYSEPPIERPYIASPKTILPRPRLFARQDSRFHLLHQRSQLHASRERLADRLEATTQDLSVTEEKLHVVQGELLTREQQVSRLRQEISGLNKSHDGAVRALNAMSAELKELKAEHATCSRWWTSLLRRTPLLKRCRIELHAKIESLETALQDSQRDVQTVHGRFRTYQLDLARMMDVVEGERREAQANKHSLLEAELELTETRERLRVEEGALRIEREMGQGLMQNNRDLQLEIACLKHRISGRMV